jgi:branched-chain amino acid transport system substrate-binding protein
MKAVFAIATALSLVSICTPLAAQEILIGDLHPITGPASFYGLPESRAIALAVEQINAAGGVDIGGTKHTFKVQTEDDQGNPTVGVSALKKLDTSGVRFIIGPLASGVAPALFPIIDRNDNITQIIDGTIAEGVTNGRNIFRNQATVSQYDVSVVSLFKSKGFNSVAVMTDRFHAGFVGTQPALTTSLKELGANVVAEEGYKLGDTDFSAILTRIASLRPAVLLIRGYPAEGALITKQARQLGFEGNIVWEMVSPPSTVLKNISSKEMEGVYNCIPYTTEDYIALENKKAIALEDAYKAKFNQPSGELSVLSFDSVHILKAAIEKAGSIDNSAVNSALKKLKVADVPALISDYLPSNDGLLFDDKGQVTLKSAVSVWQGEGWHPAPGIVD